MIYKHNHLKQIFLQEKQIIQVTHNQPLIVIVQQKQFLQYTIEKSLKHLGIPHHITTIKSDDLEQRRKNMGHQVPTLIFRNQILQTNELIQFICNAFIKDNQLIDFQSRKTLIKDLVSTWRQVFLFENYSPYDFSILKKIGVNNKKSYQNLVIQRLQTLSSYFQGKIIQKAFSAYNEESIQLQNIIFVDIINTIMRNIPESLPDYYLRCSFAKLIELKNKNEEIIEKTIPRRLDQKFQVVLQYPEVKDQKIFKLFRLNHKRFIVVFSFLATMYGIFAKP